ncbi:TniB family NTP-binding protein [Crocinitomicaceae bacterium CZZ-1]|uniref:TniB family NTP-binding protein n=1 Tax=Taishania pollutisoli TaxID=2766479 RepID=A0A8J6PLM1_9FLAO|nr:TniB family NTP-binding protein [Taishania pollutisoli]MBC9813934.1 TniB family NTP-binding protein [Taishania pollutisoli]
MTNNQDTRIDEVLKERWIGYTRSTEILKSLELLFRFHKSSRMQNVLIMGESNNGKTTIARKFLNSHPPYLRTIEEKESGCMFEVVTRPVIMVQCPHIPNEKRLYYEILDQLNLPYRKTTKAEYLQKTVINALKDMDTRVLILDEVHHILSGSPAKQREFLNLLKYISNTAYISIVALGTNEASFALKAEKQLDTRFDKMIIPRWKYDSDFIRLLMTIEKILPLEKESNLAEESISKELFRMSNGILGEVVKISRLAAIEAIESGIEKITPQLLKKLNYTSPFDNSPVMFH